MSESVTTPVDDYRRAIEEAERDIRPLATSVDGRQFTFQASLHGLALQTGGYVVLERDGHAGVVSRQLYDCLLADLQQREARLDVAAQIVCVY